jgi:hypothetical protein
MIPSKILKDHDIELSEMGRLAFAKAVRDVFPIPTIQDVEDEMLFNFFVGCEMTEAQCMEVLARTIRYARVWGFS